MFEEMVETFASNNIEAIIALVLSIILIFIIIQLALYVFGGFVLMFTARKLNEKDEWLAWIPFGNLVLMSRMAQMPWWPVLFFAGMIIPYIGTLSQLAGLVFVYIWWWKIIERRGIVPPWTCLLTLIPVFGWIWSFVLWSMLAWKE